MAAFSSPYAMRRFRLNTATLAVEYDATGKGSSVMIPAGSEVATDHAAPVVDDFNHSEMIPIEWNGRLVNMFLLDLMERGQRVDAAVS